MATITATLTVTAETATTFFDTGLEWPPITVVALPDPSGLDPLGSYPLIDSIISTDTITADDPVNSPENRVAEYVASRTETLRSTVNKLIGLANLLDYHFLHRDGEDHVTTDDTDPENPVVTATPSYMRQPLDLGGFKITGLADATAARDLVNFGQYQDVLFSGQDDVEQVLDNSIIRRDGTISMGADLNMGDPLTPSVPPGQYRVINAGTPTQADHVQTKGAFDTQTTAIQSSYLPTTGTLAMTGDLDMQDGPTATRFKIINVASPTLDGDLVNLLFLNQQIALIGGADVPVGTVMPMAGMAASIPANFLLCDGREISRTLYQNLFNIIGVAYGTPTNSNVFRLPDLRGRTIVGLDNMGGVPAGRITSSQADTLGGVLGIANHPLTIAELPSHDHNYNDAYQAGGLGGAFDGADTEDSDNTVADLGGTFDTDPTGSATPHLNIQPSLALNWMIRF